MALSVVASGHSNITSDPLDVTLSASAQPDDCAVVILVCFNTLTIDSISGLGGTWEVVGNYSSVSNIQIAVGRGLTSGSTVSLNLSTTADGRAWAYLVRGDADPDVAVDMTSTGSDTSLVGPSVSAASGDLVFNGCFIGQTTGSWPTSETPSGGWTSNFIASLARYSSGYCAPTSTAQTTATSPGNSTMRIASLHLAPAAPTEVTATLEAVAPAPIVALEAVVPPRATLAAVPPSPIVELTATTTDAGAVQATLEATAPAPVVAFEAFVGSIDTPETRPIRTQLSLGYLLIPPAADPPNGVDPLPVVSSSHIAPAISEANPTLREGSDYPLATRTTAGIPHVFIGDVDCTYLGGAPIIAKEWKRRRPVASTVAAFEVPAMQAWHRAGVGTFAPIQPDAPVEFVLIDDLGSRTHLWSGFVSEDAATVGEGKVRGFTADGTLWQASYTLHEPPHYLPPTDIGVLVARALNSVPNRRWSDVPEFTTGIMSRFRGSSDMSVMEYVVELLARAWTDDGRQWTLDEIAPGEFRGLLKPDSGYDWTITNGVFGVEVSLSRDEATRVDAIYGKGTEPNGGQWRGTRFPGLVIATPPPYPNNDASSLHLGDTDASTDSGTGVSDWQRRMVELGYSLTIDGVLNSNDITVVRRLQQRMGLLVDGVIGPQTWAGSFNRGPEGIDLTQWREPIAAKPWTQEFLRDPNGVILGENPEHDPDGIIHAIEVDFGTDITWSQAQPLAQRMLEVEGTPALTGTIRMLGSDPHEGWAGLIREGDRIRVLGWQGEDPIVTVAAVDVDETDDGLRFVFTVDERSRDALSVEAILERNRDALPDLARRPGNPSRESRLARDRYVQWDIDSPCGWLPRTAVFGGLWVAPNPIPFSEVGRVVKALLTSTVPFTLALMGLPTKPSQMHAVVGNPHAQDRPWSDEATVDALIRLGWIESWGAQGQRCGYSPGQENEGDPFTGRWEDFGGFDYISGHPPYVWPLLFSSETGFIGGADGDYGRFYPGTYL